MEAKPRKRKINRWIALLLLVGIVIASIYIAPIRPPVLLPGEALTGTLFTLPVIGEFRITNTFLTTLIVDLLMILLAIAVSRGLGDVDRPSRGLAAVMEVILSGLYNTTISTAGKKWARTVFPVIATIILLVLTSNLLKLIPGMESIGWLHRATHAPGYERVEVIPKVLSYIVNKKAQAENESEASPSENKEGEVSTQGSEHVEYAGYEVVPFFRSPSTDLNFTASLAIVAVFMIQVIGVRANGLGYFSKFLNLRRFTRMWTKKDLGPFDVINPIVDIFVGVLETISEFAKIISFSFRLLGSMFGGAILVIVLGTMIPPIQFGIYFLELFFGVIQALVFGMLTLVFMTVATQSHGQEAEHTGH